MYMHLFVVLVAMNSDQCMVMNLLKFRITFPCVTNEFRRWADDVCCCRGDADHAADDTEVVGRGGGLDGGRTQVVALRDEVRISGHVRRTLLRCRLC